MSCSGGNRWRAPLQQVAWVERLTDVLRRTERFLIRAINLLLSRSKEPRMDARLDRQIALPMMGDWALANRHRIWRWISVQLWGRPPPGSRFAMPAGPGGGSSILRYRAVGAGWLRAQHIRREGQRTSAPSRSGCARSVRRGRRIGWYWRSTQVTAASVLAEPRAKCPHCASLARMATTWT
jgi:hypothetical protein